VVEGRPWGLLGHSRGGAVSILAAPDIPEAGAVVSWSGLSKLDRYTPRRKKEWKKTGRLPFTESRSESGLWLDYSYYRDIEENMERYDVQAGAAGMGLPHLIVHGRHDRAVTMKEAERLLELPREAEVRMEIIEGCGHAFGAVHPMDNAPRCLQEASVKTALWLRDRLLPQAGAGMD
ncbi:MAG TPA: hypothetical protein VLA34_00825, partial [Candidatus Krumholzibacterium sp.]|nr:hypothetical protein [Candidatus Krumholzibacterium sp.]